VASQAQFDKVQRLIRSGIEAGATLVCGGPGRPDWSTGTT
jgi:acyl-CoA reductase-like NAD-dependent aldehyde dehydrogenase